MTWFRKHDPKEVARLVREKAEKWERERAEERDQAARQSSLRVTPFEYPATDDPDLHPWDQPANPAAISPADLTSILLAGWAMVDWMLEERPSGVRERALLRDRTDEAAVVEAEEARELRLVDPPPGWCLHCGRRGTDMRNWRFHSVGCPVGIWLGAASRGSRGAVGGSAQGSARTENVVRNEVENKAGNAPENPPEN